MRDIVIYGAGGFGKEVYYLIQRINKVKKTWNVIGFLDDDIDKETGINEVENIGDFRFVNSYSKELSVIIAIGNPKVLKLIRDKITNQKLSFPNIIDPTALLSENVTLGVGNIIAPYSIISCDVNFGDFNLINTNCGIGHDVEIGSYNVLNPNVQISGSVVMGDSNIWGLNSSIVQGKKVPNDCTIGACSLVLKSIRVDGGLYWGVPAMKQKY